MPDDDRLRPAAGVAIPPEELEWRYSTAGGPGGQHANTSQTRADVRFDVAGSPSLPEWARARLLAKLGPVVETGAGERRSQARNRDLATSRLVDRLAEALVPERPRRPTRPTQASKRRRLDAKRRLSETKRQRRRPSDEG
jgi:ribosome-associated protein